ncbi:MAG: hypothetical protein R3F62_17025 [Planctomycetota bacterium]
MLGFLGFTCTLLVLASGLAWCAERRGFGAWGVTGAVLKGDAKARLDLRFLAFSAGLTLELVAVASVLPWLRALALGLRLLVFGLGLPALVLGAAASADLLRAGRVLWLRRGGRQPRLPELLVETERALGRALEQAEDDATRAVLTSISETLDGYKDSADRGPNPELRTKIQGLLALTESCVQQELNGTVLEAKAAASHEEVRKVYETLARAYRTTQAKSDAQRFRGITEAYRRLVRRARAA